MSWGIVHETWRGYMPAARIRGDAEDYAEPTPQPEQRWCPSCERWWWSDERGAPAADGEECGWCRRGR